MIKKEKILLNSKLHRNCFQFCVIVFVFIAQKGMSIWMNNWKTNFFCVYVCWIKCDFAKTYAIAILEIKIIFSPKYFYQNFLFSLANHLISVRIISWSGILTIWVVPSGKWRCCYFKWPEEIQIWGEVKFHEYLRLGSLYIQGIMIV